MCLRVVSESGADVLDRTESMLRGPSAAGERPGPGSPHLGSGVPGLLLGPLQISGWP